MSSKMDNGKTKSAQPPVDEMLREKRTVVFKEEVPDDRGTIKMPDLSLRRKQQERRDEMSGRQPSQKAETANGREQEQENVPAVSEAEKAARDARRKLHYYGEIGQWFQMLCWIKIPVFGFFYILVMALRKKTPQRKKTFAIAYLLYRILVLLLAMTILYVLYKVGLGFVDEILRYAGGALMVSLIW